MPIIFDAPVQVGGAMAMETIICTNGSGPNWGGCDIWISSDDQTFKYAGTQWGGTAMGTLTANFASGSDPDTVNTLAVDLTASKGTVADADAYNTLALVDDELIAYSAASLTAQYKYSLGTYIRRGIWGTAIAAHSSGAPFARLRDKSFFTRRYRNSDIGKTIYVKLLSFNQWGGGKQRSIRCRAPRTRSARRRPIRWGFCRGSSRRRIWR